MGFLENLGKKFKVPGLEGNPFDVLKSMPKFGALLREYRTLHGVSIEELAAAVDIAPGALREIEDGKRPAPSTKKAKAISKALNLDAEEAEALVDSADLDSPFFAALKGNAPIQPQQPLSAAIFVFLIADIRGYTSFTARYGDRAAATLTMRFAEQAHAVMERWGGRLVELRGDEALGVFASAQQAIHAAHDLHDCYTALTRDNPEWPDGIGVGLDIGEAEQVEGGYRGAALNRAARLCSIAAPGETLVTTGVAYVAPHIEHVVFTLRSQEHLKGFDGATPVLLAAPGDPTPEPIVDAAATREIGEPESGE